MERKTPEINNGIAYFLWAIAFITPVHGLQRFYVGKPVSGTLYLLTFGFFYIGQILDVFFIPSMVEQRNRYLAEKTKNDVFISFVSKTIEPALPKVSPPPTQFVSDDPMIQLLQTAAEHQNVLSVGQAMISLQMPQEKVEGLLRQAIKQGLAHIDNDPESGAVRYYFDI